jgi:Zinc carboxypeptidase
VPSRVAFRPVLAVLAIASLLMPAGPAPAVAMAASPCDPFLTVPERDPAVPTPTDVLGFELGSQEVTAAESNTFIAAMDAASDRIVSGTAAVSVGGRDLDYAIVGTPDRVTPAALAAIRDGLSVLRDPVAAPGDVAAALAATPAILWVSGNVHGSEESGADASLHALYELTSRTDCVVDGILADAVVVILPIQNPDGREENTRRNLYGFDMNRDWFARTQPETDGKLELLREYPAMLFIDAHEFGSAHYFFPPNADPEYHEIPDTAHDWINELYSPAIEAQFDAEGIRYWHGAPYDFFAPIFGDTVPTVGFGAAGMTFEKKNSDRISVREHEQFTAIWASLAAGAAARDDVVEGWRASYEEAYQQGVDGVLEPNAVFEPKNDLYQPVPDLTVRHYFLRDDAGRASELATLVRRLQRMDVAVYRLTAPLSVPTFHPYGDPATATTLPAGTYWIPMAQGQKHWIQAMLNEESWIPYQVTYDVTAWSNPLLMNLGGGWTGDAVSPTAVLVSPVAEPAPPAPPAEVPSIGLFEIPNSTRGFEAAGQLRYLFDRVWELPYADVTADDIVAGLAGIDVLVIPDGYTNYAIQALGQKGKRALRDWVNAGGRVVASQGGVEVLVKAGVSTVKLTDSKTNAPGTLVRVSLDAGSPLADGIGARDWLMYEDDPSMQPGLGAAVAVFPAAGSPDYATSGLTIGIDSLAGSSAVVDEAVGAGRVVAFSVDPNFRAWTQGTQRILWNALLGPDPVGSTIAPLAGSRERAAAEKAAQDALGKVPSLGSAIRIRVNAGDAAAAQKILDRHGAELIRIDLGAETLFLVANRDDLAYDEHPFFALLVRDLDKAGIALLAASLP